MAFAYKKSIEMKGAQETVGHFRHQFYYREEGKKRHRDHK